MISTQLQKSQGFRFRFAATNRISFYNSFRKNTTSVHKTVLCVKHYQKMLSASIDFDNTDKDNIAHYEYHSAKYTPIDSVLRKLTQLTVPYIPNSWSPNGITLFGFAMDVLGVIFLIVLKDENGYSSRLACLLYAILSSIYVYMDMLDGKQSRKLGCNSPMGQLFDHGCDSLNGSCLIFAAMKAVGLSDPHIMAVLLGITGYVFLTFQIIEYYQGVLMYGTSLAGVTEVELLVILINLISAWKGVSFWNTTLTLFNHTFTLQQGFVVIVICVMGGVITMKNIKVFIMGTHLDAEKTGNKNNTRFGHFSRFVPILYVIHMK